MAPVDEGFRIRLQSIIDLWIQSLATSFKKAQKKGTIRDDIDPNATAEFLVASIQGITGLTKSNPDLKSFGLKCTGFSYFLKYLKQ